MKRRPRQRVRTKAGRPSHLVVAGLRAVCIVEVGNATLTHLCAAPVELFRSANFEGLGPPRSGSVRLNHCTLRFRNRLLSTKCTFFASVDEAWIGVLIQRTMAVRQDVRISFVPHLDYLGKFQGSDEQSVTLDEKGVTVRCLDHPEIVAAIMSDASRAEVEGRGSTVKLQLTARRHFVAFAGGTHDAVDALRNRLRLQSVAAELSRAKSESGVALADGATLRTPDRGINRFFHESRIWFLKACRCLPLGSPHRTDTSENDDVSLLTASIDYPGVFANDCVQSSMEGMIVAPRLRQVFVNGCAVLRGYMEACGGYLPESVECITGSRLAFIQSMKIGQHPEWIASVASLVLLTGDAELGHYYRPAIRDTLRYFQDSNGDGVSEWDTSAYPEQPDTTGYRSGVLYAQAWWVWAYGLAAEAAEFLGFDSDARELRDRAAAASKAMEERFGRDDGYGSWLNQDGSLHPHRGHSAIIPLSLGLAPAERARRVLEAATAPDVWLPPFGPRRADAAHPVAGGDVVWGFMRWNLVSAMFRYGQADRAAALASQWSREELAQALPAPESFPRAITGITGNGYVWTAARALRSLSFGLFGIELRANSLEFNPVLPTRWRLMELRRIPYRGRTFTVRVVRGADDCIRLDGRTVPAAIVSESDLRSDGKTTLEIRLQTRRQNTSGTTSTRSTDLAREHQRGT